MVDVVPEEAVHEQEHWYIGNEYHVGLLALHNSIQLGFPPALIWIPSTVSDYWHIATLGCPTFPA